MPRGFFPTNNTETYNILVRDDYPPNAAWFSIGTLTTVRGIIQGMGKTRAQILANALAAGAKVLGGQVKLELIG